MSNIISSFYALAKNNNGFFKSEKQAGFLLSQCANGVFKTKSNASFGFGIDGSVNNSYDVVVICDQTGVVSIVHIGGKSRKEKVFFTRQNITKQENDVQVQAKDQRKAEFARLDKIDALHRAQLLRCEKLKDMVAGMSKRLRVYSIIIKIEAKQAASIVARNSI